MSKQKTKQSRELLNNPRLYQDAASGAKNMLACTTLSVKGNTIYGVDDLSTGMLRATIMDSSVGGCANAVKQKNSNTPSDRWYASAIKGISEETVQDVFQLQIARQVKILKKMGKIPKKGLTVAMDLHLICRYDRTHGEELTRSKYKNGTTYFERYMTVHCVDDTMRVVLAAIHLKMLDSVPKSVNFLLKTLSDLGVKVRLALCDREFFSVDTMQMLIQNDVSFLIPCRNTPNVKSALDEYSRKKRDVTSECTLQNDCHSVPYTMIIERRKGSKDTDVAEEKYIGFATNCNTVDVTEYASRWGIESGYGKIEECRAKTRIKDNVSRMLCFYYSLILYNEWIIIRAILCDDTASQSIMTMLVFKVQMDFELMRQFKPPPG